MTSQAVATEMMARIMNEGIAERPTVTAVRDAESIKIEMSTINSGNSCIPPKK